MVLDTSLNGIGDRLAGAHASAVDVKSRLEAIKLDMAGNAQEVIKALNKSLEDFNKSMDDTLLELTKLIGRDAA